MRLYRAIALAFAVIFAAVGVMFLAAPGEIRALLDQVGIGTATPGMPAADVDSGLFRALAVAYMYLVALLAWMMFRRPTEPAWPTLLSNAKLASATVSFVLFVAHRPYLVYPVNGVVDGLIGATALLLRRRAIRWRDEAGSQEAEHEHPAVPA